MRSGSGLILAAVAVAVVGCSSSSSSDPDAQYRAQLPQQMHDSLQTDLTNLITSAQALQSAAPTPSGRGWDATLDADAITKMRAAWRDCRIAYEHIEGALAPIFPDLDNSLDARYDDFLSQLAGNGDPDPFDGQGGTGMHWIERILYANQIPQSVVDFESTLPGYAPASFPPTAEQAVEFKSELVQKLIDDATKMKEQWQPAVIDVGVAFQGLISLMNEQREKVNKAATGEEESRYAQMTLFDLRNNLAGTAKIYALFQPWIRSKKSSNATQDGPTVDAAIIGGFQTLSSVYDADPGDAIPQPPPTWSSDNPTVTDLTTAFGELWSSVHAAVDPSKQGSVVSEMNEAAVILGFPQFVESP